MAPLRAVCECVMPLLWSVCVRVRVLCVYVDDVERSEARASECRMDACIIMKAVQSVLYAP